MCYIDPSKLFHTKHLGPILPFMVALAQWLFLNGCIAYRKLVTGRDSHLNVAYF